MPKKKTNAEERARNDEDNFIFSGETLRVSSSNVYSLSYAHDAQELLVTFLSGQTYAYGGVSEEVARAFFNTSSVGGLVWSELRNGGYGFRRG